MSEKHIGRPVRADEPARIVVTFRVTARELAEVDHVARENDMARATLLRDALNSFVADYRDRGVFLRSCG